MSASDPPTSPNKSSSWGDWISNKVWYYAGPGMDKGVSKYRREQLSSAQGSLLEIGAGHGYTLLYLDPSKVEKVTCIEPNAEMHMALTENAKQAGFEESKGNFSVHALQGETEALASEKFDVVVTSFVLCTVSDEPLVLQNIGKWLKPGGRYLFMEHAGDVKGTWRRWAQEWATPVWKASIGQGCCLDRDHVDLVEAAKDETGNSIFKDVEWREIGKGKASWSPAWFVKPLIMGSAVRA